MTNNLRHWATHFPDGVVISLGRELLTWHDLEAPANQLARVFESLELFREGHVAAFLSNTSFMFVVAWAAYLSGLYLTLICPLPTYQSN